MTSRPHPFLARLLPLLAVCAFTLAGAPSHPMAATTPAPLPTPPPAAGTPARLVLGGGCFWCTEAVYQRVPGVLRVTPGYAGGHVADPTYEQVCGGATGHAEVIEIEYDPARVTFRRLVDLFWDAHDPTTRNRQGADVGPQYRSILFHATPEEKQEAEASRTAAQPRFRSPIVTELAPLDRFWPAEEYHHDYYARNPRQPYNQAVIRPKLDKLEERGLIPPAP